MIGMGGTNDWENHAEDGAHIQRINGVDGWKMREYFWDLTKRESEGKLRYSFVYGSCSIQAARAIMYSSGNRIIPGIASLHPILLKLQMSMQRGAYVGR